MGRKRANRWRWRVAAALLLAALAGAAWAWWQAQHWTPARDRYPVQGVLIGADDGPVDFRALAAVGASFVYLEASQGSEGRDARFADNLALLNASGLPFGVAVEVAVNARPGQIHKLAIDAGASFAQLRIALGRDACKALAEPGVVRVHQQLLPGFCVTQGDQAEQRKEDRNP